MALCRGGVSGLVGFGVVDGESAGAVFCGFDVLPGEAAASLCCGRASRRTA